MGYFTTNYLDENGRRILIIGKISINDSVQFWDIPDFVRVSGLLFLPNLQATADPTGWGNGGTYNQNWGGSWTEPYIYTSAAWGASAPYNLDYLPLSPINPCATVHHTCDNFLCCRCQERL